MQIGTTVRRVAWVVIALAFPASSGAQDRQDTASVTEAAEVESATAASQGQIFLTTPDAMGEMVGPHAVRTLLVGQAMLSRSSDTARSVSLPEVEDGRLAVQLPWDYYVPRPDENESAARIGLSSDQPSGLDETYLHAQPVTWADGPLTFDPVARHFEGTVSVFLRDSIRPSDREEVVPPFSVILTSDADSLDRNQIDLGRTGFPPEYVRVTSRHPGDSVRIDIRTPSDARGIPLHVPVRPTVVIETPPRTVPGWGVGEFRATVELHGPLPDRDVRLRPSIRGDIDSSGVHMGRSRATQLTIRSQGLGTVPLSVAADGFVSDRVEFEYVFPFWFFGMGILGAVLGATFATARSRKSGRWVFFLNRVGLGLAGMLAYFVLGVQIFAIGGSPVPISEIAVLTVALLSALVAPNLVGLLGGGDRSGAEAP